MTFLLTTMQTRSQRYKTLKKKPKGESQPIILYPLNTQLKNNNEMKTFTEK